MSSGNQCARLLTATKITDRTITSSSLQRPRPDHQQRPHSSVPIESSKKKTCVPSHHCGHTTNPYQHSWVLLCVVSSIRILCRSYPTEDEAYLLASHRRFMAHISLCKTPLLLLNIPDIWRPEPYFTFHFYLPWCEVSSHAPLYRRSNQIFAN